MDLTTTNRRSVILFQPRHAPSSSRRSRKDNILTAQGNLANAYHDVGRLEISLRMRKQIYSGRLTLDGEENEDTLLSAGNYASILKDMERFEGARSLMRKTIPVARRVLGASHDHTLKMRTIYAQSLYKDDGATLDDLREALTTLEETERTVRRVFGGAHPLATTIELDLRHARAALRARETPP